MRTLSLILVLLIAFSCSYKKEIIPEIDFVELQTNTDASLRALHVVNDQITWASGSKGTVINSLDGGENWNVFKVPGQENNDFRSLWAWDAKRALVFGISGPEFAFLTSNGGVTWKLVYQDSTKGLFFDTMVFADELNGLAISDQVDGKPFLIRTENGGVDWQKVDSVPGVYAGEANFAASNTCIKFLPSGHAWFATGGSCSRVFYSTDFGKTWNRTQNLKFRNSPSLGVFSIDFKNSREGVVVGGTYDQPELNQNISAFSNDGGLTWTGSETMPKEFRSCVQFFSDGNEDYVLAIGKTGCDISDDNGKNWKFISNQGYYTLRAVPGTLTGFAAGSNGRVAKFKIH